MRKLCFCLLISISGIAMAEQLTDPTRPPQYQGPLVHQFEVPTVNAIIIGSGRKLANVGTSWVNEGGVVNGVKVVGITSEQVVLERNLEKFLVPIAPQVLYKTKSNQ